MSRTSTITRNVNITLSGEMWGKIVNAFSAWSESTQTTSLLALQLKMATDSLQAAMDLEPNERVSEMALSQELQDLKAQVAASVTVMHSAEQLIAGFTARLDAIAAAKDAEIRDQVLELSAELNREKTELAAAIEANTNPTPPSPPAPPSLEDTTPPA